MDGAMCGVLRGRKGRAAHVAALHGGVGEGGRAGSKSLAEDDSIPTACMVRMLQVHAATAGVQFVYERDVGVRSRERLVSVFRSGVGSFVWDQAWMQGGMEGLASGGESEGIEV